MITASDVETQVLGHALKTYNQLLAEQNLLDFSGIQVEALRLLAEHATVSTKYRSMLQYLMIDEYQDINYIQEQLVFALANECNNICVVGDDDQGLYRFRGPTIRNILQFADNFAENECTVIHLENNYRPTPSIVDFYSRWMNTTSGAKFAFEWDEFRFKKNIVAAGLEEPASASVLDT